MRARIADIIYHASQLSGVSVEQILGRSRLQHIMQARHAAMLVAREQMGEDGPAYSFPTIGRAFDGKDHSTIIHGCAKAINIAERDPVYAAFIQALRDVSANSEPFAGQVAIASPTPRRTYNPVRHAAPKSEPLIVPERTPHIKKIMLAPGETPDDGHTFHAGIGMGSAALLKALAA